MEMRDLQDSYNVYDFQTSQQPARKLNVVNTVSRQLIMARSSEIPQAETNDTYRLNSREEVN